MSISFEQWDVSVTPTDLTKCFLTHIGDVSYHAGLSINVVLRSLSTLATFTYFMCSMSPALYVTSIGIALMHCAALNYVCKRYEAGSLKTQELRKGLDRLSQDFVNNYTSMRYLKLRDAHLHDCSDILREMGDQATKEGYAYARMQFVSTFLPRALEVAFIAAIMCNGLSQELWECMQYYHLLVDTVTQLKDVFLNMARNKDGLLLLDGYIAMDTPIKIPYSLALPSSGTLRFEDVTFAYPTRPQLEIWGSDRKLNLAFDLGDRIAIAAPSGTGKTTFIKLLMGFYPVSSGRITLNDTPLHMYSIEDSICVVPQDTIYFAQKTLRENLLLSTNKKSTKKTTQELEAILQRLGLEALIGNLDGNQAALSGGQRQRLAIAQAMISDAPIVVLDEPSSSLDKETAGLVMRAMDEFLASKTVILITHDLQFIKDRNFKLINLEVQYAV
ncbi:Lipid A export ATP-binding/permease protein MsbA [Tetrabaena socialis]|uniref:Lipid A export ATP-binding/permease protein MsbA n=1 Tax=Tetrabaena socialis TaxID=47790 RepID=A0A2J7ZJR1_9CHLO|nr:Lipid A export ATP-binding/permease protein MsbA [Tetrabaena socialis]|eukprot:PNH00502.1 Lipid A export ATP-binding/permease protein MsbA [Tetrabaena socialis]